MPELMETIANLQRQLDCKMRDYDDVQVPVSKLNNQGFVVRHARYFAQSQFRGGQIYHWV